MMKVYLLIWAVGVGVILSRGEDDEEMEYVYEEMETGTDFPEVFPYPKYYADLSGEEESSVSTVSSTVIAVVDISREESEREPSDSSLPVLRLFCHLVVVCPYCVCTALMVSICCSRKTGNKEVVSMEMTQRVRGGHGLDEECDDVTADVTTENKF